MNDDRATLLPQLTASRQQLQTLLDGLAHDEEIYPGWSKKEFVAHLTGWEDAVLQTVLAHVRQQPSTLPVVRYGIDYYNNQSVLERLNLTYEQIMAEWAQVRQELVETLRRMTPEAYVTPMTFPWGQVGPVSVVVGGMLIPHEQEHAREIRDRFAG
jgi:hypothetical protein